MSAKKDNTKQVGGVTVNTNVPTKTINGIEYIQASESTRLYEFPNGRQLQINGVRYINVSESRGHRLITESGQLFYVKPHESWFMVINHLPTIEESNFLF